MPITDLMLKPNEMQHRTDKLMGFEGAFPLLSSAASSPLTDLLYLTSLFPPLRRQRLDVRHSYLVGRVLREGTPLLLPFLLDESLLTLFLPSQVKLNPALKKQPGIDHSLPKELQDRPELALPENTNLETPEEADGSSFPPRFPPVSLLTDSTSLRHSPAHPSRPQVLGRYPLLRHPPNQLPRTPKSQGCDRQEPRRHGRSRHGRSRRAERQPSVGVLRDRPQRRLDLPDEGQAVLDYAVLRGWDGGLRQGLHQVDRQGRRSRLSSSRACASSLRTPPRWDETDIARSPSAPSPLFPSPFSRSRIRPFQDPILGIVNLPLADVFANSSEVTKLYSLQDGVGFGKVSISILWKSIKVELPRELSGWETGVVRCVAPIRVEPVDGVDFDFKEKKLVLSTLETSEKLGGKKATTLSDRSIEWDIGDDEIRLPTTDRYSSALTFDYGGDTITVGPLGQKVEAFATLWLAELVDDQPKEVRLPVVVSKSPALRTNYVNEQTEKTHDFQIVGWLTTTVILDSGLDADFEKCVLSPSSPSIPH